MNAKPVPLGMTRAVDRHACQACGVRIASQLHARQECPVKGPNWSHVVFELTYRALPCGCCATEQVQR